MTQPTAPVTQNSTYDTITYDGVIGPAGPTGPQGPQGDVGPIGPQGPQGIQGVQGPTGAGWVTSLRPPAGTDTNYPIGTLWLKTDTGAYWLLSSQGPPAVWTIQGTLVGPAGPAGTDGAAGPVGPMGPTGPAGADGATGATGASGPAGAQGAPGPQGPVGAAGQTGPQGPIGQTGAQGPTGATGPQGPAGLGLNIKGTVPTFSALPAQPQPQNDAYTTDDTGHLYSSNGTTWVDTGLVRGPAGATGPQGIQGVPGPTGADGPVGPAGAQGIQGVPGATGPMGPAGVVGPVGPAGPTGPVGPVGPAGPTGPRGPQGPPGDPFGAPVLAIGSIVHFRVAAAQWDRYGYCKPAVVLSVFDPINNTLSLHVLGPLGHSDVDQFQDRVPTGHGSGSWHFVNDCPYAFNTPTAPSPTAVTVRSNGIVTFPVTQAVPV